jgi:hypothetical protein
VSDPENRSSQRWNILQVFVSGSDTKLKSIYSCRGNISFKLPYAKNYLKGLQVRKRNAIHSEIFPQQLAMLFHLATNSHLIEKPSEKI